MNVGIIDEDDDEDDDHHALDNSDEDENDNVDNVDNQVRLRILLEQADPITRVVFFRCWCLLESNSI